MSWDAHRVRRARRARQRTAPRRPGSSPKAPPARSRSSTCCRTRRHASDRRRSATCGRRRSPPIERTYDAAAALADDAAGRHAGAGARRHDVSAAIAATQPILVERAMYRSVDGQPFAAGHASAGVTAAATSWFLAEGATGAFFDLFVLLANPNDDGRRRRDPLPADRRRGADQDLHGGAGEPPDDLRRRRELPGPRPGARQRDAVVRDHVDQRRADRRRAIDVVPRPGGDARRSGPRRTTPPGATVDRARAGCSPTARPAARAARRRSC